MKLEAKIGLFVVLGILSLFLLSTQVTSSNGFSKEGYEVYAYIDDATGLQENAKVLMNGVKVGEISKIKIDRKRVKLFFLIDDEVAIPKDSSILMTQESVLGAKTINILAGDSSEDLVSNEEIEKFNKYAAFDETSDNVNLAAIELKLLVTDLRDIMGSEQKDDIKAMLKAFRNLSENLDGMVSDNRLEITSTIKSVHALSEEFHITGTTINADLPQIMKRIDNLTLRLDTIAISLEKSLPEAVDKFIKLEDNATKMLEENREAIHTALSSADGFFGSGQEAFDKVDSLLSNFTVSELQIGIHIDYMLNDGYVKSYGTIAYLPNPETYYLLDIISMADYSRSDSNGTFIEPQKHENGKLLVSAQYAKRYNNLLLRGGVIESTGGVGMDYMINNDEGVFSLELFDWNAVNDIRGTLPHAKVNLRYKFLKHIEVYGGWDNFLNHDAQNIYFGVGVKFIDNNLKYILGSGAAAL